MDGEKREKIVREFVRFIQEYSRDVGCTSYDIEVLKGALALLQQPVEHGLGIRQKGSAHVFKCSACGFVFAGAAIAKHCPNCGAKMDGGAEL